MFYLTRRARLESITGERISVPLSLARRVKRNCVSDLDLSRNYRKAIVRARGAGLRFGRQIIDAHCVNPGPSPLFCRLRCLLRQLQHGEIPAELLQRNLHYAARVLEAVLIDETK